MKNSITSSLYYILINAPLSFRLQSENLTIEDKVKQRIIEINFVRIKIHCKNVPKKAEISSFGYSVNAGTFQAVGIKVRRAHNLDAN